MTHKNASPKATTLRVKFDNRGATEAPTFDVIIVGENSGQWYKWENITKRAGPHLNQVDLE